MLEGEDRAEFGEGDGEAEDVPLQTPTTPVGAEVVTPVEEFAEGEAPPEEEEEGECEMACMRHSLNRQRSGSLRLSSRVASGTHSNNRDLNL